MNSTIERKRVRAGDHMALNGAGCTYSLVTQSSSSVDAILKRAAEQLGIMHKGAPPPPNIAWFLIRHEPEFDSDPHRIVAMHKDALFDNAIIDPTELGIFWEDKTNIVLFTEEFVSAAMPIWHSAGIDVPREDTACLVAKADIDQITADSVQAALFNMYNTSRGPVDMQAAAFAIASFLHAHPYFNEEACSDPYRAPYGDDTRYGLARVIVNGSDQVT